MVGILKMMVEKNCTASVLSMKNASFVCVLNFVKIIIFMLLWGEHEKSFITFCPEKV